MQDSPFFPSGGRSHSQYSPLPTHAGMARLSRPGCLSEREDYVMIQKEKDSPRLDYRPVCQQSYVMQDSPFFPSGGRSHSQYLLLPTHGGMAQVESTWVPGSVPGWFNRPNAVKYGHPSRH